jgi:hypothetical protein
MTTSLALESPVHLPIGERRGQSGRIDATVDQLVKSYPFADPNTAITGSPRGATISRC